MGRGHVVIRRKGECWRVRGAGYAWDRGIWAHGRTGTLGRQERTACVCSVRGVRRAEARRQGRAPGPAAARTVDRRPQTADRRPRDSAPRRLAASRGVHEIWRSVPAGGCGRATSRTPFRRHWPRVACCAAAPPRRPEPRRGLRSARGCGPRCIPSGLLGLGRAARGRHGGAGGDTRPRPAQWPRGGARAVHEIPQIPSCSSASCVLLIPCPSPGMSAHPASARGVLPPAAPIASVNLLCRC